MEFSTSSISPWILDVDFEEFKDHPRAQKTNQLLRKVYELEVLEREIKRTNGGLTKRNAELYDSLQEMKMNFKKMREVFSKKNQYTKTYFSLYTSVTYLENQIHLWAPVFSYLAHLFLW